MRRSVQKLLLCCALAGCGSVDAAPTAPGGLPDPRDAEIAELRARVAYLTREVEKVRENARRALLACPPK